jgi:hypothetical protein
MTPEKGTNMSSTPVDSRIASILAYLGVPGNAEFFNYPSMMTVAATPEALRIAYVDTDEHLAQAQEDWQSVCDLIDERFPGHGDIGEPMCDSLTGVWFWDLAA